MYEFLILAHLMRDPMHGYRLAQIVTHILGPYTQASHGRVYPLLARLEAQGCIAAREGFGGDGRRRVFQITETGRERFYQLMMETGTRAKDDQKMFWKKVAFFEFLNPEERLHLVDQHIRYCQAHSAHIGGEIDSLAKDAGPKLRPDQMAATVEALRYQQSLWQHELDLVRALRDRLVSRAEASQASDDQDTSGRPDGG